MREPATLAAVAAATAHRHAARVAARWRLPASDEWRSTTWGQLARRWRHGALGLEAVGFEVGERVGVVAEPGPLLTAVDHAVLAAGAVSVVVDPCGHLTGDDLVRAGVRRVVTDRGAGQDGFACPGSIEVVEWDRVAHEGARVDADQRDRFEKLVSRIRADAPAVVHLDGASIVERTHEELLWSARSFERLADRPPDELPDDHTVALLPVDDPTGRTVTHDWPALMGVTVWWPADLDPSIAVRDARPTVLVAGAPAWRAIAARATARSNQRWVATGRLAASGEPVTVAARSLHRAVARAVRGSLERRVGLDRCRARFVVGALDRATARELAAVGIAVRRTWSHAAAGGLVCATGRDDHDDGSPGRPVPGVSVRVGADGIDVRSPGGRTWVRTGLHGELDADGRLHFA